MKKWTAGIILGCAQFVMVLDSTVMNVSISTVVKDLNTTVAAMQAAITFYTLTMASLMLLGAKLGDVWGRRRAFVIGAVIYACGSLLTALSPNIAVLFLGWSVIEGVGAVLVIPAIAALIANNYQGQDRVTGFAIIGATSGAAVALGPLIGGYVTTYLSWRYVFIGEVVVMAAVLLFARLVPDASRPQRIRIDGISVLFSAAGLTLIVFAMLQSKTWGWILPKQSPEIGGVPINPLGLSLVPYLILAGGFLVWAFFARQEALIRRGRPPLVHVSMLSIKQLRSGLSVLAAQYMITAGLFFMIPVYLQMTLGLNALDTGIKILPLSISLILFSVVGTRLTAVWSPRRIVRLGQLVLVVSSFVLLGSVSLDLRSVLFAAGMFFAGAALGLLASQIGNVTMSSVGVERSSEIGGLQGIFQNLGSSLGTALIGSVLIASLSSSFLGAVETSDLPGNVKDQVAADSQSGVNIVPVSTVNEIATSAGLSPADAATLTTLYTDSQVSSLRASMVALVFISSLSLLFSKNIPTELVRRKPTDEPESDPAQSGAA
ncbi:MFS transporter [Arthrobacter sp. NicSoilB8]|uniref:MFS transporter n=1 Tax=Arthrobacter sp. NicSoilB8 TaxID=2830998 RepID=UPI001CC60295|nr:MFS transporter [Arthrobacter sp. NicSoilB8]BCW71344.1 MFS transporter [Arthrobacter sp. NicSoilB8]